MEAASNQPEQLIRTYSIGIKLRALRTQKGLTLSRLASETGLSTALLSKLETERMVPTLSTLAILCRVYGIGLGFFFSDEPRHAMSITRSMQKPRSGRRQEMKKQFRLNGADSNPILAREVNLPPQFIETLIDVGKVFVGVIYVLEGRLNLESAGQTDVLDAGDCVCLNSEMLISWGAAGTSWCRTLVVTKT